MKNKLVQCIRFYAVCLSLALSSIGVAQEKSPPIKGVGQPTILVSTSKFENLLTHVSYLMRTVSQPEIGGMISLGANNFSRGLDRDRPIAISISMNDRGNPEMALLLPVIDLDAFVAGLPLGVKPEDLGGGLYAIEIYQRPAYLKKLEGWIVVAQDEDTAKNMTSIPTDLIQRLSNQYDFGARVDVQSISKEQRDSWFAMMKESFDRTGRQQFETLKRRLEKAQSSNADSTQVSKLQEELRLLESGMEVQSLQAEELKKMIDSTKQLVAGLNVDQANRQVYLEVAGDFVSGSVLSSRLKKTSETASKFASLTSQPMPVRLHSTDALDAEQIASFEKSIAVFFDAGLKRLLSDYKITIDQSIQDEFRQLITSSIQEGVSDSYGAITFEKGLNALVATRVPDGEKVAATVKKFASSIDASKLGLHTQFDAYQYQGSNVHLGSVAVPAGASDEIKKIFGDAISFAIGTAPKGVYIAVGNNCEDRLKASLDTQSSPAAVHKHPMELKIDLLPVAEFVQSIQPNQAVETLVKAARAAGDANSMIANTRLIPNGFVVRITLEEGVLKAVGAAAKAGQGQRRGGF